MDGVYPPRPWFDAAVSERRLPLLVLVVVALAYAPSLGGDWVWDDWTWKDASADALFAALGRQVYGGIWRPLSAISLNLVHLAWPDPLPHKLVSLGLHLGAVAAVAWTARGLGARPGAAWGGAAVFGLHPAVTETVCWIGARTEVLPATLLLIGLAAWIHGRRGWAAACLFAAPFAKEAYAAGVLSLGVWMWTLRRWDPMVLGAALAGALSYLGMRVVLVGPGVAGASYRLDPLAALGAAAVRGGELLVDTRAPDLWNPYAPAPTVGAAIVVAGILATFAARGRPALGAWVASLPPLAPSALAASSTLLLADRYYYVPFAGVGLLAASGLERIAAGPSRRWVGLALGVGVPAALGLGTLTRAAEWRSELDLAEASWQRHPDNPMAAEHYAYAEERWGAGCAAGMEAWRVAAPVTRTAAEGLQRCLVKTRRYAESLELARTLRPTAAVGVQAAIAAAELGDLPGAERWARAAVAGEPSSVPAWVQLGYVLHLQGRAAEAHTAFAEAFRLDPDDPDAQRGMSL